MSIVETTREDTDQSQSQPGVSRDFIRTEPLAEVRARLRAERDNLGVSESKRTTESRQASTEQDTEEVDDTAIDTTQSQESQEDESESGQLEGSRESTEVQSPDRELARVRQQFQTLSANTKALSDQNKELLRQIQESNQKQQEAQAQAQRAAGEGKIQAIQQYIQTLPPEQQGPATEYYRSRILAEEAQEYYKYLQQEHQTVEQQKDEIRLREVRAALPEYTSKLIDFIGEQDDVPTETLKEVVATQPFQALLGSYQEQRDIAIIGAVLRAVGLVEKSRRTTKKAENRQTAVETQVHRTVKGVGTGNSKTLKEQLAAVPSSEWARFKKEAKQKGLKAALDSRD
jgi:hypothetical protein